MSDKKRIVKKFENVLDELKCLIEKAKPTAKRVGVSAVFVFPNGNVAVMGYDGQQVDGLQGRFDEVRDRVWAAADKETEFSGWPGIPDGVRGKH